MTAVVVPQIGNVQTREDDGGRGIADGRVGDVRTREGTVVSQMGGWTTCEQKGTVAVVSLLGDVRTRRGQAWCNSNRRVGDM